ncbi:hypothetical protein LCGC14_1195620 [marine sediment metagenome]|uniref:Uncharacterized protein n=1 Tax=marine sediment metagenome TaxID=412755 RepID=A0A0F9PNE2_9ZZZZ
MIMEYEINIATNDKLETLKRIATELLKGHCYIFFDEDWADIMIRSNDYGFLSNIADLCNEMVIERSDEKSDIEGFGEQYWEDVKSLFEIATRIGLRKLLDESQTGRLLTAGKLIHCLLNNLGYSRWDEFETCYRLWKEQEALGLFQL